MALSKLTTLMDDIKFSFKFANTHMNVGMPSFMQKYAARHGADIDRLRQTDVDAGKLTFKESIRTRSTDPTKSGTDDYKQMVDIIMRRGGLGGDHYIGPNDLKGWAELKNLAPSELAQKGLYGKWDAINRNAGLVGIKSVLQTAYAAAVSEVSASVEQEVTPVVLDAILTAVVDNFNAGVDVGGETVTVAEMKSYIENVTDGAGDRNHFDIGADGWN